LCRCNRKSGVKTASIGISRQIDVAMFVDRQAGSPLVRVTPRADHRGENQVTARWIEFGNKGLPEGARDFLGSNPSKWHTSLPTYGKVISIKWPLDY
jgi:hypothetical protein